MMWWMCLCAAAWLTDFGWQVNDRGEVEYIVQIEPDLLDDLRRGEEIVSEIPPELTNVRRVRIRVGTGAVPRGSADPPPAKAPSTPLPGLPAPPSADSDSVPLPNGDAGDMEPPPLLPRGGAFEPPRAGPADSEPRGGTFPIERKDTNELQPIPRSPGAKSLTERLSERLDASSPPASPMRPASHVEPASPIESSPAAGRPRSATKRGTETKEPASSRAPSHGVDKKASPGKKGSGSTDGASNRRSAPASPSRQSQSEPKSVSSSETTRPWGPLFVTSLLLFASIGLNLYLGWVTFGAVQRYRELARESAPA